MLIRQPTAGCFEIETQVSHHQVNRSAAGSAHEAAVGVLPHAERETGVVVLVERTQGFVVLNRESESLCDPLYWEVAELLKFEFIHNDCGSKFFILHYSLFTFKYFSVLLYSPVCAE